MRFEHLRPQGLAAREGEQLAHEARGPVRVLLDLHDVLEGRIRRPVVGEQQVAVADDGLQHVVEVVRHAAGELADRVHLLGLGELLLDLAQVGGVEGVEDRRLAVRARIADRRDPDAHRAAAFSRRLQFERRDVALVLGCRLERRLELGALAARGRRRGSTGPSPSSPVRGRVPKSLVNGALAWTIRPARSTVAMAMGVLLKKRAKRTSAARWPSSTSTLRPSG